MQLPFTVEQFFGVFRDYNEAVWPMQWLLLALGAAALSSVLFPRGGSSRVVSLVLALLWVWLAVAYHFWFFTRINPLAWVFGLISLVGALVLAWQGVVHHRLRFGRVGGARAAAGICLVAFALLLYPAWSWLAGHRYPAMPTFGTPCPTTLFTLGVLAFAQRPCPRSPFVVPILWSIVGAQAAFLLGVHQDLGLVIAAIVGILLAATAGASRGKGETAGAKSHAPLPGEREDGGT